MAKGTYNTHLSGDEVRLKKYFYSLRPVLAAKWVIEKGTMPPIIFDELVSAELDPDMVPLVEELVRVKRETPELGNGAKIPELNEYLLEQIEMIQAAADSAENRKNDWDKLEEFFRSMVL